MPERIRRCRYLKPNNHQCTAEAADPDSDMLLCFKHLQWAYEVVARALKPTAEQWREHQEWMEWRATQHPNVGHVGLPTSDASIVYYVRFQHLVKIGTTINLTKRLTAIPHDEVLATERGDYTIENERHWQFRDDRVKGEWFRMSPALMAHIARLDATA